MSRNYTATLSVLADTLATLATTQTQMLAVLDRIDRSQSRVVDLLTSNGQAVTHAAPAAPKAATTSNSTKPAAVSTAAVTPAAPKPVFTAYVHDGDLHVGILCPKDAKADDVLTYDMRVAVARKMTESHRSTFVWLADNGRLNEFRSTPKAQRHGGYATMRIGRPDSDETQASMIATAYSLLVPTRK